MGSLGRAALGTGDLLGGKDEASLELQTRLEQPRGCFILTFSCSLSVEDISSCWGGWGLDLLLHQALSLKGEIS